MHQRAGEQPLAALGGHDGIRVRFGVAVRVALSNWLPDTFSDVPSFTRLTTCRSLEPAWCTGALEPHSRGARVFLLNGG